MNYANTLSDFTIQHLNAKRKIDISFIKNTNFVNFLINSINSFSNNNNNRSNNNNNNKILQTHELFMMSMFSCSSRA